MLSVEEFEDAFVKRLEGGGRRSTTKTPPSGRSKSISRASRRKTLDPLMLSGNRGQPVPQVSEVGCGCKTWNRMGLGIDLGTSTSTSESARKSQSAIPGDRTPPGAASSQTCPKSANLLPKAVSGIFRRVKSAPPPASSTSPKFEEQWSSFRVQHQQEMNEMKEMYSALQSMCQEIKTITGLQPQADSSPPTATPPPAPAATAKVLSSESKPSIADETPPPAPKPTRPTKEVASEKKATPETRQLVTPRRARSVPRARTTTSATPTPHHPPARDLSATVNLFFKSPWTDTSSALFEEIVQVQKTFLRSFCQSLAKHREATLAAEFNPSNPKPPPNPQTPSDVISSLVARILPHTSFAKPWHLKYAVEAWVNRLILGDFGTESYGLTDPVPSAWDEYQRLALLSPSDAINPKAPNLYHESFHLFCNRKFQTLHDELQWWEEWPAPLVEEFLEAMKHVWRAHKLAFSFDAPAAIFCVKTSTAFDPKYMETVLDVSQFDCSAFSSKVGFMVTPGFLVHGQVIKSQVYLMPKVGRLLCSPAAN